MATRQEIEAEAAKPLAWFQHDTDAANDMKLEQVIDEFGMVGYGRWWRLCEMLAAETGHRLEVGNERVARIMARRLKCSVSDMMKFVIFLHDVELVTMNGDGFISNERMNRQAERTGTNRANGRRGGRPKRRAEDTPTAQTGS